MISTVKAGVSVVWDGIKTAGQFIGKSVLSTIYSLVSTISMGILVGIVSMVDALTPFLTVISYSPLVISFGNGNIEISVASEGNSIVLTIGNKQIKLMDLLFIPGVSSTETLSSSIESFYRTMLQQFVFSSIMFALYTILIKTLKPETQALATMTLTMYFLQTARIELNNLVNGEIRRQKLKELQIYFATYHGFAIISSLASIMLTVKKTVLYASLESLVLSSGISTLYSLAKEVIFVNLIPTIISLGFGGISQSYEPLAPELFGALRGAVDVFVMQKLMNVQQSYLTKAWWMIFLIVSIMYHSIMQALVASH